MRSPCGLQTPSSDGVPGGLTRAFLSTPTMDCRRLIRSTWIRANTDTPHHATPRHVHLLMSPQIPINGPREVPTSVVVPAGVLETKAAAIEGLPCKAFTPHDADPSGYLSAREDCWNKSVKDWPSVIAMPSTKEEVITCVKLAAGKKVAVLSGGHSPMCMPNGAFLIRPPPS